MSDACESGDIKESFVEDENKVKIEETSVNLGCVKNEPNEDAFNFAQDSHAERYRITLESENIFGEPSYQRKIEEDSDNLIGFLDNCVLMENATIKLETIKEEDDGSFNNFYCSKCKGVYNGYCLKCSTLLHILNKNSAFVKCESESNAIPTDILEIRETSRGKGVYLLRTLPMNIIFGPFEGVLGIEHIAGHSWKIVDNKLTNIKSGNWMKNIYAASDSLKNLEIFQFEGNLYFQTNREISEGEELLIYYDDDKLRQLDNSEEFLYTPKKQEKLLKIFACTMCCFGFGSSKCLMEHKRKCFRMEDCRSVKDIVLVECYYCKMWLEKWEHEEHHAAYCLEKYHRIWKNYSEAVNRNHLYVEEMDDDCGTKDDDKRTFQRVNLQFDAKDYDLTERSNNEQNAIETNNKRNLQNHLRKHRGIKAFNCDICMKEFGRKEQLKMHIRNKHTDDVKDYECSECAFQSNSKSHFQNHLNVHSGIKQFKCDICMMTFTWRSSYNRHIKSKHTDDGNAKTYKCLQCLYRTNHRADLQKHLNKHSGIKAFKCDICAMAFTWKSNLKAHIKNMHATASAKDYKCLECFYQTNNKSHLQDHLNKHKDIKQFQCDICMKKFIRKGCLNKHIKNKHTNNGPAKDYKCLDCSYRTIYKNSFEIHLNTHRGIKPFSCDICVKKFTQKSHLTTHIKNKHTGDGNAKDYKCLQCSYQTSYKLNLQTHLNMHKGIKPFTCDICMMSFTCKSNLTTHIKNKHANDRSATEGIITQFQCDICMKKYGRKSQLKMHIKNKHTGDASAKDYKCSECNYQTNSKYILQSHLNKHRGIKPFQCDICMMAFTWKCNLNTHIKKKHTNDEIVKEEREAQFQCDICMKYFREKGQLKMHIKNKHTDKNVKDYKCPECSYQTNYKRYYQSHLNKHRGIKPFSCDICTMAFTLRTSLNRHIKNKHTANAKDYNCLECSYQTNYYNCFQWHLNKHRGIKPFKCDICMKDFGQNVQLKAHIRNSHTDDGRAKDHKCSECSYATNHKSDLQCHLNKHRGIKPFECDICMMAFTWKSNLKAHMKNVHIKKEGIINVSAKDYQCSECTYQTNRKADLQKHLYKHRGIKPFKCDICAMIFSEKGHLNMHIKNRHTSTKDYKCVECFYQTNYRNLFENHLNKHKGIKPFQCDICLIAFTQKAHLNAHIKNKHADDGRSFGE